MYHVSTVSRCGGDAGRMWEQEPAVGKLADASVLLSTCFFVFRLSEPSAFLFSLPAVGHFGVLKKLSK